MGDKRQGKYVLSEGVGLLREIEHLEVCDIAEHGVGKPVLETRPKNLRDVDREALERVKGAQGGQVLMEDDPWEEVRNASAYVQNGAEGTGSRFKGRAAFTCSP